MRFGLKSALIICLLLYMPAFAARAQTTPDPVAAGVQAPQAPEVPAALPETASGTACCSLPDGTFVELEVAELLTSKTAQRGQHFKLRLAEPLRMGERVLVPAGAEGVGEIIHADRARAAGKPGELLLAARFLVGPTGDIKLRGMKLGGSGKNNGNAAMAVAAALGPIGFLVRGGEIEIPIGTRAHAKLAGQLQLSPDQIVPVSPPQMDGSGAAQTASHPQATETSESLGNTEKNPSPHVESTEAPEPTKSPHHSP